MIGLFEKIMFICIVIKKIQIITIIAILFGFINISSLYAVDETTDRSVDKYYEYYRECLLDIEKINSKSNKNPVFKTKKCNQLDELTGTIKNEKNRDLRLEEENISVLYKKVRQVLEKDMNRVQKERTNLILAKILNIKYLLKKEESDFNELVEVLNSLSDSSDVYIKEEAMFLKASLYDRTQNDKAWFYYKLLSDKPVYTKYGIASSVLIGDYYFNKSQYKKAYSYYKKAYENIDGLNYQARSYVKDIGSLNSAKEEKDSVITNLKKLYN